jgi:hypothetical protein
VTHYACTNCGFWQRRFATPTMCPVCEDFRHPLPPNGYRFLAADEVGATHRTVVDEPLPGVLRFATEPSIGIGSCGWLLCTPAGNVHFEGTGWYDADALAAIEGRGGVQFLSASHAHVYGALWQVVDRFRPRVVMQVEDLNFTQAFRVDVPFDDRWPLLPDVDLHHTAGHTPGHTVLHCRSRRLLMAGDALKFTFAEPGQTVGEAVTVSCHAAFDAHIPLSHRQVQRYREVMGPLDFDATLTPWEVVVRGGKRAAMQLFDRQLAGDPFADRLPIANG